LEEFAYNKVLMLIQSYLHL